MRDLSSENAVLGWTHAELAEAASARAVLRSLALSNSQPAGSSFFDPSILRPLYARLPLYSEVANAQLREKKTPQLRLSTFGEAINPLAEARGPLPQHYWALNERAMRTSSLTTRVGGCNQASGQGTLLRAWLSVPVSQI